MKPDIYRKATMLKVGNLAYDKSWDRVGRIEDVQKYDDDALKAWFSLISVSNPRLLAWTEAKDLVALCALDRYLLLGTHD